VYDPASPTIDPAILNGSQTVLGICYGQQLIAHLLGGAVKQGRKGEYGLARLNLTGGSSALFTNWRDDQQIWMSHRDTVEQVPAGFSVLANTSTCAIAAIEDPARHLYGVQFHPEVVHTTQGRELLSNFLFDICGCRKDWDPRHRIPLIEAQIRETVGDRNVFFFVSGGVDSTVAYTLCLRALGPQRVRGVYVDTGLMRAGETEFVRGMFDQLSHGTVAIESAQEQFLRPLAKVREPEEKRQIIGEEFVLVQERIIESRHLMDGHWILGQGTIYPDTIESGGTANAAVIKTHHNRVAGIQKLLAAKRIIEPLSSFYKDEVREIGAELGLPKELCSEGDGTLAELAGGWLVPVLSVGVQGDSRSYAPVLAIEGFDADASDLVNSTAGINRVIARVDSIEPLPQLRVWTSALTAGRLSRLREADETVRRLSHESGFDRKVWQFPVVLIPLGTSSARDSVVLRPIDSMDGMTAQSVLMDPALLQEMSAALLQIPGIAGVFYDLTHKPPATIEWE
jgi:GMP synthase (glutamine-hydrolysing)